MKTEKFTAKDGKELNLVTWDEVEKPKGVVHIAHGMSEHIERYDAFAKYLNENGFVAIGFDQRAHGYTDKENLGICGEGNLFEDTVSDIAEITNLIKERFKLPIVFLGHSYGSFLAQSYITKGAENLAGVILSGSALMRGAVLNFGYFIAKGRVKKGKSNLAGEFFANQTFKLYDKKIKGGLNDWLSRDTVEVGKYNTNPFCGFYCSNGFYASMFEGLRNLDKTDFSLSNKSLKLFIMSGSCDGVGNYSKLTTALYENYKANGFNPALKLYEGARHEILNETNKLEVYKDMLDFANSCVK